jgi:deazaflavin-dependent oxidoreductase (nitroreductase family)
MSIGFMTPAYRPAMRRMSLIRRTVIDVPLPRAVAHFNKSVTNRILGPVSAFLPGFGTIEHRGRTSGRDYRTPIMAFRSPDGRRLVFALTYGSETDWLRNFVAAGEAAFDSRWSGRLRLTKPRVVRDPVRGAIPRPIRWFLRLIRVGEFLEATIAG